MVLTNIKNCFFSSRGHVSYMREMNPKLKILVPVVRGLARILGEDYEVNLHDLSMPEHSLVLCENGHVTGRQPGGPMTDFGLFMMQSEEYKTKDGVFNYLARNNRGELIRCSAIFIRDEAGETIAFLCLNYSMNKATAARELLESLLHINPEPVAQYRRQNGTRDKAAESFGADPVQEWFARDLEEVVNDSLSQIRNKVGKPLNYLSKQEKQDIVRELRDKGFFKLKGSVEALAAEMGNTKYTIYSYIRELQKKKPDDTARKGAQK